MDQATEGKAATGSCGPSARNGDGIRLDACAPVGLALCEGDDARVLACNPVLAGLFGRPAADVVGVRLGDLLAAVGATGVAPALGDARTEACLHLRVPAGPGEERVGQFHFAPVGVGRTGEPRRVAVYVDLTAQKQAGEDLRVAETVFTRSAEACLLVAPDLRPQRVNPAFTRVTGWTLADLAGPDGVLTPAWEPLVWTPGPIDAAVPAKDGTPLRVRGTCSHVLGEDGNLVLIVAQFADTTEEHRREVEKKRLAEQLRRAQRMETVGRLAGGVAHDFNNMLSVVLSSADLLRSRALADPRVGELAEAIHGAARRAGELTRRLMIFGRRDFAVPEVQDLNAIVRDLRPVLARSLGDAVSLELDLAPEVRGVLIGAAHVEQVLMNLAVNAREAMPRGGCLRIRTADVDVSEAEGDEDLPAGAWVRLDVSDDGEGMRPEVARLAFEPFFTTRPAGKGTGLGLAIVPHTVESARGQVRLESAVGQGTTVVVHLPATGPIARREANPTPARQGAGERILVVEDEPSLLGLFAQVLLECGYSPTTAGDGATALATIERDPTAFDVVLTDVVMPGMSGPELAKRVRERWPALPVIFMSGHTPERVQGADGRAICLQKPFSLDDLRAAVGKVLEAAD